jgi:hypothetical protein
MRRRTGVLVGACFVLAFSSAAIADSAKKLVEFGWDEPDTAFMRKHIGEMERTPFDGCVFRIMYRDGKGKAKIFNWDCWGTQAIAEADVREAVEDLKATPFQRFTENFLRLNVTPANVDWFDDFSAIVNNVRVAASVARQGKCRGVMLDVGQYQRPLWSYRKQRDAAAKPWDEYAKQARARGTEVMRGLQEGLPGLTVFLTFGYSLPWSQVSDGALADCSYGLLAPFLDGMFEAAGEGVRIVDGYQLSYAMTNPDVFALSRDTMENGVLPIVADRERYRKVASLGFGIWLDCDWRTTGWYTYDPQKNFRTPESFEESVRRALEVSDRYVWIYTEVPRWWTATGKPTKLPKAYDAALRRAREPAKS